MKRHPIVVFLVLGVILTWACLIPVALASHGKMNLPMTPERMLILGAYGPLVAALVAILLSGGTDGLSHLLGRFLRWRFGFHWYLIALLVPVVPLALHLAFGGQAPMFLVGDAETGKPVALNPWAQILPILYLQILKSKAFADEAAWRGFLLPRLLRNTNALVAAIGMGLIWCVFQSPMVFINAKGIPALAWIFLAINLFSMSIIYTWIFNSTKGSLLPAVLFNISFGATEFYLLRAEADARLQTATLAGMALIIVAATGIKHLSRNSASAAAAIADEPGAAQS